MLMQFYSPREYLMKRQKSLNLRSMQFWPFLIRRLKLNHPHLIFHLGRVFPLIPPPKPEVTSFFSKIDLSKWCFSFGIFLKFFEIFSAFSNKKVQFLMLFCTIFASNWYNLHVFSPFFIKNTQKVDSDSELEKRVSSKNGVRIILVVEAAESTTAE